MAIVYLVVKELERPAVIGLGFAPHSTHVGPNYNTWHGSANPTPTPAVMPLLRILYIENPSFLNNVIMCSISIRGAKYLIVVCP